LKRQSRGVATDRDLPVILVDTNIIAPLYLRTAGTRAVAELFALDGIWCTEPLALIELSNVLITFERARYITAAEARDCLNRAAAFLQLHLFRVSHRAALDAALRYRVTAYDGRFLVLARQLGRRLVTEDTKLRSAAPTLTQSLAEALARS
jgi:predicted nucleic acid-binding protein